MLLYFTYRIRFTHLFLSVLQPGFPQFDNPSFLCNVLITSDAVSYDTVAMQRIVIQSEEPSSWNRRIQSNDTEFFTTFHLRFFVTLMIAIENVKHEE